MLHPAILYRTGELPMSEHEVTQDATRKHYEERPFDFIVEHDSFDIEKYQPAPFKHFVATYLNTGEKVADVGCGPGRDTCFLKMKGMDVTGIDISPNSIELARKRAPGAHFICASNLNLPVEDETYDAVVSDGVIHHTPDANLAFREDARILKKNGYMYLAVYRRWRYYFYVYTYVGKPVRWIEKFKLGRLFLKCTAIPVYFAAHKLKHGRNRNWEGVQHLFYDYIITPQATFHTLEQIVGWGKNFNLELVEYFEHGLGNCHAFIFKKSP
jgi:ubiquinone/menaquinone biosynthesis C-methylase UbiE